MIRSDRFEVAGRHVLGPVPPFDVRIGYTFSTLESADGRISKAIEYLYEEKKRLERAIASLEELRRTGGQLPDEPRPPGRRGRKSMDLAEREEVSRRMKKYWASRRGDAVENGTHSLA